MAKAKTTNVANSSDRTVSRDDSSSDSSSIAKPLQQYVVMKQALVDFVLDAEGEIATELEAFSAKQLGRWSNPALSGLSRSELAIDMFVTEGVVNGRSLIEWFIDNSTDLLDADKNDLQRWIASFSGLFVVSHVEEASSPDAPPVYTLMNWLTEKRYRVYPVASEFSELLARMSPGEIVLARLLPVTEDAWTFSGPFTLFGKLGKPKLAVAIGNFRKWFPDSLYGDAPALKEAAWNSVRQQYDDFIEIFGGEQVTLSGYELNKKFQVFQDKTTDRKLAESGLDSAKSLKDLAVEAGVSAEEISEAIGEAGSAEGLAAKTLLESDQSLKMVMPKVSLPDEFRNAKAVSVFVHPRWGQSMLTDYVALAEKLTAADATPETAEALDRSVAKYLEKAQVNAYVWQCIYQAHDEALTASLRRVLNNPAFEFEPDLAGVLAKYGKSQTPQMPDSASVPVHLHNLFQEALQAVGKGAKKKGEGAKKKKGKKKSGFGRAGFGE